jgi:hypothetical protein
MTKYTEQYTEQYIEQKYKTQHVVVGPMFHELKWKIPEMFHIHKKLISVYIPVS